jgi:hypothetical protein
VPGLEKVADGPQVKGILVYFSEFDKLGFPREMTVSGPDNAVDEVISPA